MLTIKLSYNASEVLPSPFCTPSTRVSTDFAPGVRVPDCCRHARLCIVRRRAGPFSAHTNPRLASKFYFPDRAEAE